MTKLQIPTEDRKPSLVHPTIAVLASAIVPGLGHILARTWQRGILIIASLVSVAGLIAWRIKLDVIDIGRSVETFGEIVEKTWQLQPILLVCCAVVFILYLLIILDAYRIAARRSRGANGVFLVLLVTFFLLGWQIGEIDIPLFVGKVGNARFRLSQILWPWEKAISRAASEVSATQDIKVPCDEDPPPPNPETDDVWLYATPTCGDLTQDDGTPGSRLTIQGGNFLPNTETAILWTNPVFQEFRARIEGDYLVFTTDETGAFKTEVVLPYSLVPESAAEGSHVWKVRARQYSDTGEIAPSETLTLAVSKMIVTIFLGMMATFFGIIFALPISFFAAKNLMSTSRITLAIYYVVRTVLNIVRSVEPLIWAVIAVAVVGLGPFAGIISLTLHSIAALAKLYSEAIESIDPGPIEAIHATGANWLQTVIYAVVPQIIPPFVSFTIYRWDINVRMSTIIGLVGGGGIGYLLVQWMRLLDFKAAGIAVWFIVLTVAILDNISSEIRQRFV